MAPPGRQGMGHEHPGGHPVMVMRPPEAKKKKPEPKGMLSFFAGKPAKSSGKGKCVVQRKLYLISD